MIRKTRRYLLEYTTERSRVLIHSLKLVTDAQETYMMRPDPMHWPAGYSKFRIYIRDAA